MSEFTTFLVLGDRWDVLLGFWRFRRLLGSLGTDASFAKSMSSSQVKGHQYYSQGAAQTKYRHVLCSIVKHWLEDVHASYHSWRLDEMSFPFKFSTKFQ